VSDKTARALRWVSPAIGAALFVAAVLVLHRELRAVRLDEVRATLRALPRSAFLLSLLVCGINYGILTGFDLLAFRYIGRKVTDWKVAVVSFTGYAVSNSVGFALVSGTSVRYRFYSRWGLTAGEISRIVVFYMGTFFVGLLVLGGYTLVFDPPPGVETLPGGRLVPLLGWGLLASAAAYVAAAALRREPFRFRGVEVSLPPLRVVLGQVVLSTLDWAFGAAIFYVLLPPSQLTYLEFLSAFMAAQVVAIVSHVPGGVGVFEGTMTIFLRGWLRPEQILSSLVLYRLVYYLIPLGVALCILLADEVRQRRRKLARRGTGFGALADQVAPKVLAAFVFLAGAVLVVAGAVPSEREALRWVQQRVPLPVLETAYVAGSAIGVALLIAAHGVARRLRRAWNAAVAGLLAGSAALFFSGCDLRVIFFLLLVLGAVLASRRILDRRARFWDARFSPGWLAGVAVVVGASFWVGNYAFRRARYSDDLWLRFAAEQEFPRFLRASAAAAAGLAAFGIARLLRPPAPAERPPTEEELEAAGRVVVRQRHTLPYLVYLRDKAAMLAGDGSAFLMYAVQGRSWVVMGDPVGNPEAAPALLRRFVERCDDYGGVPVFYQVRPEWLPQYADFGLTSVKLGDEALVPLARFTLEGPRAEFRRVLERTEEAGITVRFLPPGDAAPLLPTLREVSGAWLAHRGEEVEKGFAVGFFAPDYLLRFPVAVAEHHGRVLAFATLWPGPGRQELAVDLLHYLPEAAGDTVEALLLRAMLWGREEGYARFGLGLAPLPELEISAVAPAWTRLGYALLHREEAAEEMDEYQRLRAYKERFGPVWEERFLAYPGGLSLPRVTEDVTALVEGGYRRIFRKG
jgi:phosphatidylglycerol lysyltransferase